MKIGFIRGSRNWIKNLRNTWQTHDFKHTRKIHLIKIIFIYLSTINNRKIPSVYEKFLPT